MSRWEVSRRGDRCGFGQGHEVPTDVPMYVVAGRIQRCEDHLPEGVLVDHAAVEKIRADRRAYLSGELHRTLADAGIRGVRTASGRVKPFSEVANDPAVQRSGGDW